MRRTTEGFFCKKCNKLICTRPEVKPRTPKKDSSNGIYIMEELPEDYVKITRECPHCGSYEAQRWYSKISGEHAGVRRERTIEHFKCTKCSHSWSISS